MISIRSVGPEHYADEEETGEMRRQSLNPTAFETQLFLNFRVLPY